MRKKISKVWGNIRKIDQNLRKNEESETLAHPGLWGWLRPCLRYNNSLSMAIEIDNTPVVLHNGQREIRFLLLNSLVATDLIYYTFVLFISNLGLYGHTTVWHMETGALYVYGGYRFHLGSILISDKLYSLHYATKVWSMITAEALKVGSLVRGTPTAGVLLHRVIISRRWERNQKRDSEWPINTDSPR